MIKESLRPQASGTAIQEGSLQGAPMLSWGQARAVAQAAIPMNRQQRSPGTARQQEASAHLRSAPPDAAAVPHLQPKAAKPCAEQPREGGCPGSQVGQRAIGQDVLCRARKRRGQAGYSRTAQQRASQGVRQACPHVF